MTNHVLLSIKSASAQNLHRLDPPGGVNAHVWWMRPKENAVVLGSRQDIGLLRREAAAARTFDVAERRSGGGAVLIDLPSMLWVDVLIPAGHGLWDDDLARTFMRVGSAWQHVLADRGQATTLWSERGERTREAELVCFAGRGWGELLVGERKVLGLSQRRTRWGARVQCLFDPWGMQSALLPVLDIDAETEAAIAAQLSGPTLRRSVEEFAQLPQAIVDELNGGSHGNP